MRIESFQNALKIMKGIICLTLFMLLASVTVKAQDTLKKKTINIPETKLMSVVTATVTLSTPMASVLRCFRHSATIIGSIISVITNTAPRDIVFSPLNLCHSWR